MYFYTLSQGAYSDYVEEVLYHETKWTKEQFGEMFNEAVGSQDDGFIYNTVEYLVEKFGFKKVEPTVYVRCDHGSYRKLTEEDYKRDGNELDAENKK